jgi:hypothetical protein
MANWRKADIIWDMPRDVRAGDVARPPAGATTAPRTSNPPDDVHLTSKVNDVIEELGTDPQLNPQDRPQHRRHRGR